MKIYAVAIDGGINPPQEYWAGKTEASKHARECAKDYGAPAVVFEIELAPGKAGIVELANRIIPRGVIVYSTTRRARKAAVADDIEGLM
jgi:hypothetical protein